MPLRNLLGAAVALACAIALTAYGVTEETPVGVVSGIARKMDTGEVVPNAEVFIETYNLSNDLSGMVSYRTETDEQGRFVFRNVPVGYVAIRAYAPGYTVEESVTVKKEPVQHDLALQWRGDELSFATKQPVFSPDEAPTVVANGLTRNSDIEIKVFAFPESQVYDERNTYSLARNIAYDRYDGSLESANDPKPLHTIDYKLKTRDVQGKFAEVIELPTLPEGVYVVRASVDQVTRHIWLNVSKLGLVSKVSPGGLLGYVVDIGSGKPLQGIDVSLVGPKGKKQLGKTDAQGIVRSSGGPQEDDSYVMVASQGSSRAFAMFYWWNDSDGRSTATHFVTDRTVYRPGDEVHYKGFVRVPTQDGFKLPSVRNVSVKVYDPDETELMTETRPVNAMGGFDGSFQALYELTGSYRLEVEIDGQVTSEWIPVSAYRKPEFKITVTPEENYYARGERARFKIKAEYFTGEPVVGANLSAWAERADVWRWSPWDDEEYDYYAEEGGLDTYGGEYLGDFNAVTDDQGQAVISVQTSQKTASEDEAWWYTDTDQVYSLSVSGEDPSGRYFEGKGQVTVVRGDIDLTAAFEDYVVNPGRTTSLKVRARNYEDNKPLDGLNVTVEFGVRTWTGRKTRDQVVSKKTVKLDSLGEANVPFVAKEGGDFYARVIARDSKGREVTTQEFVWVYDHDFAGAGPAPKMQVVLDKKEYAVGDAATAVLRTDRPGGHALVTAEARGVLWTKVVPLESESTTVEIPVTREMRPNVSIQVAYIREKSFASSSRSLIVDMGQDRLNVDIKASTNETLPGGTVTYDVKTTDSRGKPVSTDVALSVVDEGIYAILEDRSDPMRSFFPRRWSTVSTYYSFPEVYLDGDDKAGTDISVRTDFRDTAFWAPSLVTGDDGTASVTVKLPENLTSWRTTATAVSADASCGKGLANVVARKPVMVRVSTPAFMVQDEVQTVGASVSNETGRDQQFEVRLQATGLKVESESVQRVNVEAGRSGRLTWNVKAGQPGDAKVRVVAVASNTGQTDGLEQGFLVKTNGPTYETFFAGDTTASASFSPELRDRALTGDLEISVSPSILGGIVGSLDKLVDYPYGCVEQTMSRFMPAVVVAQYLRQSGTSRPELEAKIKDVSIKSQARLRSMQHPDGGFGWWRYDTGDPETTAYVLEGLYHADQAGTQIDVHLRDRAIEWLKKAVNTWNRSEWWFEGSARSAYALALHGVDPPQWVDALPDPDAKIVSDRELAYTVMALSVAKGSIPAKYGSYKDKAYARLLKSATETDATMSWTDGWWYEPTAVALQAVLKVEPNGVRPVKALRYLMGERRGDYWTSTRDTAQIILAAVEYLRSNKEGTQGFEAVVSVNGREVQRVSFTREDVTSDTKLKVSLKDLRKGKNQVTVSVIGDGRAYYSARLTQSIYDPNPKSSTSTKGLSVKREYFRMETRRMEDGTLNLIPSRNPVTSARAGDVLYCRLTITTDQRQKYVMVQDPALSNSRPIDAGMIDPYSWRYWWSDQSFLDDHAAIFMRWLDAGENVVEYPVRAEALGTSIALPATVSLMYQPEIRATTGTQRIEVRK